MGMTFCVVSGAINLIIPGSVCLICVGHAAESKMYLLSLLCMYFG